LQPGFRSAAGSVFGSRAEVALANRTMIGRPSQTAVVLDGPQPAALKASELTTNPRAKRPPAVVPPGVYLWV